VRLVEESKSVIYSAEEEKLLSSNLESRKEEQSGKRGVTARSKDLSNFGGKKRRVFLKVKEGLQ